MPQIHFSRITGMLCFSIYVQKLAPLNAIVSLTLSLFKYWNKVVWLMKLVQDVGIGENIRILRKKVGLTQDQVVAQMQIRGLQISRPSYSKIENDKHNLRISDLITLKNIFQCEYEDLIEGITP